MNAARRWLLVTAHFLCPLLFFTNLTRNPYVTQIGLLNVAVSLALAAWAWRESQRAEGIRLPRLPVEWPLAAFVLVWIVSWIRAYYGHADFYKPAMAAEGARNGMFLLSNALFAFWLGATLAAEDDGTSDVALGHWVAFTLIWGFLWTLYPAARGRTGAPSQDILGQAWDAYGAFLWAGGLAAAGWLCRRGRLVDFLHLAFCAGFLASVYGVCQYFNHEFIWPNVLNPYGGRAVSTFGNPNFLSTYAAALLPSVLALFLVEKSSQRRWVYGALFVALTAALLATLTRSSWGGAAIGLAALAVSPRLRARVKEEPRAAGLVLGVALAVALAWPASTISSSYTPSFLSRLTEFKSMAARDGFYSPWHQRTLIWSCAWLMGSENPVLGKGGGLFELFYPFYQGHLLHEIRFFHNMRTHANNSHNEIFEVFAQTGLLGLGAFLWLWSAFFWSAKKWADGKQGDDPVWVGAVAGTAAVLADNLLNVSMHFAVPAFLFWWLAGAAMGRGARDAGAVRSWAPPPALKKAFAAAVAGVCLYASWWQVRVWEREAWYFAGFKLIRQGNMPAATAALVKSRNWGPREVNAIYELGNVYARSGRTAEAAEAYQAALRANAGYDEIFFNLGTVYNSQGLYDKAREYYETAWAINPLSDSTVNGLAALLFREPVKNRAAARDLLAEATRIFPDNPNHWNNLGYVATLDKNWTEAGRCYEKALELSPESAVIERNLAAVVAQGRLPKPALLSDLEELRGLDVSIGKGNWSPEVLKRCAALLQRRPNLLKARFLYGSLLLANGRAPEAASVLEGVVNADPRRAASRVNLGNAYLALKRLPEAETQFRAALGLEPGNAAAKARLASMGKAP